MPVVHKYKHDSGIYLRSAIDGTFVTFQVYPSAERFITNSGYGDGDSVSWGLIKPLWERGYIYTGETGTTKQVETHFEEKPPSNLGPGDKRRLRHFLQEQERNSISVPDDVYSTLLDWHNGKYSKERARDLLYKSSNRQRCIRSIQEFRSSPVTVVGIDASKGDPAYDVYSKDCDLRCVDLREKDDDVDLVITFRGESDYAQAVFISNGNLTRWRVYGPRLSLKSQYQRDLLEHISSIVNLLVEVPDYGLALDRWDFQGASEVAIRNEIAHCLKLELEWCAYSIGRQDGTSSPLPGEIDLVSSLGYSTISTDKFNRDVIFETPNDELSSGEQVTFRLHRKEGITRAIDVALHKDKNEPERETNRGGSTKYGGLISRGGETTQNEGESDWSEGVVKELDRKQGIGFVASSDGTFRFSTKQLTDPSISIATPVHFVVSDEEDKAFHIKPIDSPHETDNEDTDKEQEDDEIDNTDTNNGGSAETQLLEAGQSRTGWIRYLNKRYGSLSVKGTTETVLFDPGRVPGSPSSVERGMAFSFEITDTGGNLRATNLTRCQNQDRHLGETTSKNNATEPTIVDPETTKWINQNASEPTEILESIELAVDFGAEAQSYESSINTFGTKDDWEVAEFSLSDEGNPQYQFSLNTGEHWNVEHQLLSEGTVLNISIHPDEGPNHQVRTIGGKIVSWKPDLNQGDLSNDERHKFVLKQGHCIQIIREYLTTTH